MMAPNSSQVGLQIVWLVVLAFPIASIAWTVTHEELFREPREFCASRSQTCRRVLQRKFFYVLTCEYCFSHYVTAGFVVVTGFHLLLDDWRGVVIAFFSLSAVTNVYLSLYSRLRIDIKAERVDIAVKETEIADQAGAARAPSELSQGGSIDR
jgi:hypothetical protein